MLYIYMHAIHGAAAIYIRAPCFENNDRSYSLFAFCSPYILIYRKRKIVRHIDHRWGRDPRLRDTLGFRMSVSE